MSESVQIGISPETEKKITRLVASRIMERPDELVDYWEEVVAPEMSGGGTVDVNIWTDEETGVISAQAYPVDDGSTRCDRWQNIPISSAPVKSTEL